jgi:hypothetical protein
MIYDLILFALNATSYIEYLNGCLFDLKIRTSQVGLVGSVLGNFNCFESRIFSFFLSKNVLHPKSGLL